MNDKKRSIPEMSLDTRIVLKRLLESQPGDTITYAELTKLVGRNVQNSARPILHSARKAALGDGAAFETLQNVGIRRCDDPAIVNQIQAGIHRIHRATRRTAKIARCVEDISKCDQPTKDRFNMSCSLLAVMDHATSTKVTKRLEQKISESGMSLPVAKMLEALK